MTTPCSAEAKTGIANAHEEDILRRERKMARLQTKAQSWIDTE